MKLAVPRGPGRAGSSDKIVALNAGAGDYVTKPFNIEELLARMGAVSRRARPETVNDEPVRIGANVIDLGEKAARSGDGDLVHLTKTEWELLALLVRNPGKLVSQRQLLQEVWGPTYLNETHYLRQYMAQIRKKLERDPTRPKHLAHRARHGLPLPSVGPGDNRTWSLRYPFAGIPPCHSQEFPGRQLVVARELPGGVSNRD